MKIKLFSYANLDTFVHRLSGLSKLICFMFLTTAVMVTYDIRVIALIFIFSLLVMRVAKIKYKQIRIMLIYVFIFLITNFVLTFFLSPMYGVELYGTKHVIITFFGPYIVTLEQIFYQCTKFLKYLSVIPLGFLFFLTTNPSEFASSLNSIKVPYKACTVVSLSLRYFPDIQRDYNSISLAQQARGLDMSKNATLKDRISNNLRVVLPLIFSTLDRVELITNAMDLRGYAKAKTRTWYSYRKFNKNDYLAIVVSFGFLLFSLFMRFMIVKGMFYNPFV